MMKNIKNLSCYLALALSFGCSADENIDKSPDKRAIFIYMAADNDLDYFAVENINQMESCFSENRINSGVYVYIDRLKGRKTAHPCLYKIRADKSDRIASEIIK